MMLLLPRLGRWLPAVALLGACNRTPPEPAPAATSNAESRTGHGAQAPSASCVVPLPATPPPVPAAAQGAACPNDPDPEQKLPQDEVAFPDAPGSPRVAVELAKTPRDVEHGLMYRRSMAEDHGMLFRLEERRLHTFWMHNTCIPLDMLFIDDGGVIVGVVESATPLTDSIRSVDCPSLYVLEMNAGWTRKRGVVPGQRATIPPSMR